MFRHIESALNWLFYLAIIGVVSLLLGAAGLIYLLVEHVTTVLH